MTSFTHQSGHYFSIDNARIYYEELGEKGRPVLILLHGGLGTMEDFNPIMSYLPNDFLIIGVDCRGQGKSTLGSAPLTYQQMQLDVEALLRSLKINRASIMGFSDGGMIGYRMAIKNPALVEKLIAVDAPWSSADLAATAEIFERITAEGWKQKFPGMYALYAKLNPEPDFEKLTEAMKKMWLDSSATGGYVNDLVRTIKCPTLIVRGDNDALFERKSAAELANRIEGASFLNVPFADHTSFAAQPTIFSIAVNTFLRTGYR